VIILNDYNSVLKRRQGLRPGARAHTCPPPLLRHCTRRRGKRSFHSG